MSAHTISWRWGAKSRLKVMRDMRELTAGQRFHYAADALSNETYHACNFAISSSAIKAVADKRISDYAVNRLFFARGKNRVKREQSQAMQLGSAVHTAVLESHLFESSYVADAGLSRSTKAGKDNLAQLKADHPDKIILRKADYEHCLNMRDVVHKDRSARRLLRKGKAESSMFMLDKETGLKLKARADYWVPDDYLVDLKTCNDISPTGFQKDFLRFGYQLQQAHYCNVFGCSDMAFICVSKEPPYEVAIYNLTGPSLMAAGREWRKSLNHLAQCIETKTWAGFASKENPIIDLSLPDWYVERLL